MRRSDIFESFVKIAKEKGLVSESAEQTEKTLDNPRWDSLSTEEIGKLYNNKPEGSKRNIIEEAHPESVIIAPSYDKLHGLVENENQRQDITLNIIMQEPRSGSLTQRKYAEQELVLNLVRVANDLDSLEMDEMRVLADSCLQQATTHKQIEKTAIVPLVIGVAVACLGALYAYQHVTKKEGFSVDLQKLTDVIHSAQTENTNFEIGYQYSPEFLNMLADLLQKSQQVQAAVEKCNNAMAKISKPKTAQELAKLSTTSEGKDLASAYEELKSLMNNLTPYFTKVIQNVNDPSFRERAVKDRGFFQGLIDKIPGLHSPTSDGALMSNDFARINATLSNYMEDIQSLMQAFAKAQQFEQKASSDLSTSAPSQDQTPPTNLIPNQQNLGEPIPNATPTPPNASPDLVARREKAPWDDIKVPNSLEGLMG